MSKSRIVVGVIVATSVALVSSDSAWADGDERWGLSQGCCQPLDQEERSFGVEVASSYLWRGMRRVDEPVLQPRILFEQPDSGVTVGAWGSFALNERDLAGAADELDVCLGYRKNLGSVKVQASYVHAFFLDDAPAIDGSGELRLELMPNRDVLLPMFGATSINPTLFVAHDFELFDGTYVAAALTPELSHLAHSIRFELRVGFSDYRRLDTGKSDFGFHDVGLDLRYRRWLADSGLTLEVNAGASYADEGINPERDAYSLGVGLAYGF